MPLLTDWMSYLSPGEMALVGSLIAGLATAVGALPVLAWSHPSAKSEGALLGFAAGVMLAASIFSLILPGLEAAGELVGTGNAPLMIGSGILLGAGLLFIAHNAIPHEHFVLGPDGGGAAIAAVSHHWLLVFAIAIHNLPEGLGLVVAAALTADGYRRGQAFLVALMTGLVEPIAAAAAAALVGTAALLLPWGYAVAAGAMLFVISHEIIPETHRKGVQGNATVGLLIGFVAMMYLGAVIG